jgi:acetyl esterase/lipase
MPSLRSQFFYAAMKVFFRYVVPSQGSLETYRKAARQPLFERMPRGIIWEQGQLNGVQGEWITPDKITANRCLLYLHGGGYVLSTPHVHRVLVGRLARTLSCRAFMPEYRLAPEHPFPAAIDDVTAAYHGIVASGYAPSQVVVAGDSAGGGLTAALLLRLRDRGEPLPAAACLISALLDCTFSGGRLPELQQRDPYLRLDDLSKMAKHYYTVQDPKHPLISPLWADLNGLPPLFVLAGENDILCDEAVQFAEHARQADVAVDLKIGLGMVHAFPLFAGFIPEGKIAIAEIGTFFEKHLPPL